MHSLKLFVLLFVLHLSSVAESQDTCTCTFTADNDVDQVYLDGVDVSSNVQNWAQRANWPQVKTYSFHCGPETVLAIKAADGNGNTDGCGGGGFALYCTSTNTNSIWHGLKSSTDWKAWGGKCTDHNVGCSFNGNTNYFDNEPANWFAVDFDDSTWGYADHGRTSYASGVINGCGTECEICVEGNAGWLFRSPTGVSPATSTTDVPSHWAVSGSVSECPATEDHCPSACVADTEISNDTPLSRSYGQAQNIAVRCCQNGVGTSDGCQQRKTYDEAVQICEALGKSLCTKDQIEAGVGSGSGCGFDGGRVWTSTSCGIETATDAADSTDAPVFIQTEALCGVFSCGDDAMLKPLMNTEVGNSFEECCACSYASLNHAFLGSFMKGEFDNQSRKLKLSFDLPSDVHIQSVEWNGASDDSLSYAKGLWTSENVNECRTTYILDERLAQIFGSGSLFTLSGTTLATSIRVVATSQITEEGTTFDRTYSEDVPILVGLESETTVQATFHMTMEEGQYVHITGNAEHYATDGTVKLTMMVTTPGCIQTSASIVSGTEHLTNPEFTFGDPTLVDNLCAQEVVLTFDPVEEFADTISIQFTSRQNVPFSVDVDVNIQAGSILDYLPFDAVMTFHAESTFSDEPQSEFLLGAEVYAKIELSPLVNLPLSSITINSFTLTQTGYSGELETTDLMNEGWAGFSYTATPEDNEIAAEFELESTHFHVTEEGELCEVETDISIVYQDGTTVRRLLSMRRRLTTQQISNGFAILESESESMVATRQRRVPSANAFLILVLIVASFLAFRACVATKRDEYSSLLTEYAEF